MSQATKGTWNTTRGTGSLSYLGLAESRVELAGRLLDGRGREDTDGLRDQQAASRRRTFRDAIYEPGGMAAVGVFFGSLGKRRGDLGPFDPSAPILFLAPRLYSSYYHLVFPDLEEGRVEAGGGRRAAEAGFHALRRVARPPGEGEAYFFPQY
jgi:hypothetical protein